GGERVVALKLQGLAGFEIHHTATDSRDRAADGNVLRRNGQTTRADVDVSGQVHVVGGDGEASRRDVEGAAAGDGDVARLAAVADDERAGGCRDEAGQFGSRQVNARHGGIVRAAELHRPRRLRRADGDRVGRRCGREDADRAG